MLLQIKDSQTLVFEWLALYTTYLMWLFAYFPLTQRVLPALGAEAPAVAVVPAAALRRT